jgi:very-short-patch-repair endonuclease
MTLSEILLWNKLKYKKLLGYDFDRQRPINNYVVDFYCKDLKLAIEIDGDSHSGEEKCLYDAKRENDLINSGIDIIHFSDLDVKIDMSGVLEVLTDWINNKNRTD